MKKVFTLLTFLLVLTAFVSAQTPMYYNSNGGGTDNSFPLNQPAGKMVQWLFLPGEFTSAPSGNITNLYVKMSTTYPLNGITYSQFNVVLYQSTITEMTTGTFYTGSVGDTVYKRSSVTLTAGTGTWLQFALDHPFAYDNSKSLIVQIEQCGAPGVTGYSIPNNTVTGNRRVWSVGGCPFVAYASTNNSLMSCGLDITTGPTVQLPDLIYYKFLNNPSSTSVINYAVPGVGNNPATLTTLTLTSGGEFDSCLSGTATASAKIATGYSLSTGTSSFTISMWLSNLPTPASTRYLFGDPGHSFRCFVGGVAPTNGAVLRGTGVTDVPINNIFPGPTVIHIVYDSAASAVKIYRNGVLDNTVSQTPFNFTAGTGFSVGGYSSSAGLEGLMDEFRFYKRALDSAEISATWNQNLGIISGVNQYSTQVPNVYNLSQNYPNPFNPVTKISFDIPKSGFVSLKIYDVLGRELKALVNEVKAPGKYVVDFDGASFASGTYFYRLESNGFVSTKKMMLIK